jgi:hypothetical protein
MSARISRTEVMETRRTGLILRLVMVSRGNGRRRDLFIRRGHL